MPYSSKLACELGDTLIANIHQFLYSKDNFYRHFLPPAGKFELENCHFKEQQATHSAIQLKNLDKILARILKKLAKILAKILAKT
jgi:hypothetical protein